MNYYLPRYDLPLLLGYAGPGLSFYSQGSEKGSNLIPSFTKQEDLLANSITLEDHTSKNSNDLINTFFSDKVAIVVPLIAMEYRDIWSKRKQIQNLERDLYNIRELRKQLDQVPEQYIGEIARIIKHTREMTESDIEKILKQYNV